MRAFGLKRGDVMIGVQACLDQLLMGYDYGTKECLVLLVMDRECQFM